ncbi:MAG: cytochrome c biogenesis protein ResB [Armatimonadetes bacterium]|nr:cytochrome c biogenesis protein ResB [Armatimonadota bacterium]
MKENKIFRFLASLKLAVLLLLALAVILAFATYYESEYDAKTAHHLVYGSPFFAAFLFLLGVNVFCAAAIRYPWKRHQLGFVLTHAGILTILAGSLVTMFSGLEGALTLKEGESGSRVALDQPVLYLGQGDKRVAEISAEFRWNPPREGNECRYPLVEGTTAVVDRYYHNALEEVTYQEDPMGKEGPAIKLRLHNSQVDSTQWLSASSGPVNVGPATIELRQLSSPPDVERFLRKEQAPEKGELQLLVDGQPHRIRVAELPEGRRFPIGTTGISLRLVRYLPYAVVENQQLVSRSDDPINPAVELEISDQAGSSQTWLLFAKMSDLNTPTAGKGEPLTVRALYAFEPGDETARTLTLGVDPAGKLFYRRDDGSAGPVSLRADVATGWMDLQFQVVELVRQGRRVRDFREIRPKRPSAEEGPPPAIRLRVEGSSEPGPHWFQQGDVIRVPGPAGSSDPLVLGYGLKTADTGVQVRLKDFRIGYDPGTENPASYSSVVEVDGVEHVIAMNEPMVQKGYTFFQSSYSEIDGQPILSIFSVAYDPGIQIKYVGCFILVLGITVMFYMKPYRVKNPNRRPKALGGLPAAEIEEEDEDET